MSPSIIDLLFYHPIEFIKESLEIFNGFIVIFIIFYLFFFNLQNISRSGYLKCFFITIQVRLLSKINK